MYEVHYEVTNFDGSISMWISRSIENEAEVLDTFLAIEVRIVVKYNGFVISRYHRIRNIVKER